MKNFRQDLLYAWRMAVKAPSFTIVAVLVLGVGIGVNTAMFSFANELFFRPLWGQGGEMVGVYSRDRNVPDSYRLFSYPAYQDILADGTFEVAIAQTYALAAAPAGDGARRLLTALVSSNYFDALGVRLAAGRPFTLEEERPGARVPVAIVAYPAWKRAGLDPAFVGRTLTINSDEYTIIGVAPEGFSGTMAMLSPEVFLPLGMFDAIVDDRFKNNGRGLADRANFGLSVSGRFAPGVTIEGANARLDVLSRRLEAAYPVEDRDRAIIAAPLSRMSMSPSPQSNTALATFAAFLLTLSGLVLVVACLNIANMLLARGTLRRKEIAVRLALGARRARVIRQLLTESLLLAVAGAGLGLMFSYWAMSVFVATLGGALPFNLALSPSPDATVLGATVVFTAIGTVAFGLGPALSISRRNLVSDLKDRSQEAAAGGRWFSAKNLMVVGQVALSLALLTAGGIFTRTTVNAAEVSPGYSYDGLILARVDTKLAGLDAPGGAAAYSEILSRTRSLPGVVAVSIASTVPFGDSVDGRTIEPVGGPTPAPQSRARAFRVIGADYFAMLGLKLVKGREFTSAEESAAGGARVAIIDEELATRLFGPADPVGQVIRVAGSVGGPTTDEGQPMEIVGVAPPMKEELLDQSPVAHVYIPFGQHHRTGMFIQARVATGVDPIASIGEIRRTVRDVNPRIPVLAASTMQAFHDNSLELLAVSATAATFSALGLVALVIACIGVYGLRAYLVAQRTREIGIRIALGATSREVIGLILKDGAMLTLGGLAVGVPLGLLVSVALRSVFVDVGGIDIVVLATASIALAAAVTLAGAMPARRATKVEPLIALRTE